VLLTGLWSRRGLNLSCFVVTVVAVSASLLGPMYGRASAEHLLDTRIDQRAPYTTGLTYQVPALHETRLPFGSPSAYRPPDPVQLVSDARAATQGRDWDRYWQRRTPWLLDEGGQLKFGTFLFEAPLYWRQGMCSLADVTGRCPTRPGQALVQQTMARTMGVGPGDVVRLHFTDQYTYELHDKDGTHQTEGAQGRTAVFHVVGTYTVPHPSSPRWYDLSRFTGIANLRPPPTGRTSGGSLPHTPALLVAPGSMTSQTFVGGVDLPIDTAAVNLDTMAATQHAAGRFTGMALGSQDPNVVAELDVTSVFATVRAEHALLSRIMLAALAPFVVLALLLLFALVSAAAQVRRPHVALAKLRGHSRLQVLRFAVSEPALVVALATPVAVVLAYVAARLLARTWLSPITPVVADQSAVLACVAVVSAALLASALAAWGVMREPLASALASATSPRRASRAGVVLRSAVVAVAIASVAQLLTSGHQGSQLLALVAPLFIALAVAVAGAELLRRISGWWLRRTARARGSASYLASRRLARRRDLANLMLPLLLAVSVIAFAGATSTVSDLWRTSRANAEVGAAQTYLAATSPGHLLAVTHRVDPHGRWLMAAVVDNSGDDMSRRVFLDSSRLAAVTSWDPSWSSVPVRELQRRLAPPPGTPLTLTGTRVSVQVADVHLTSATRTRSELWLQYVDRRGEQHQARLGGLADGASATLTTKVTGCAAGCTVQQIYLSGQDRVASDAQGSLTIAAVSVDGQPVDWRLHDAQAWRPARPFPVSLVDPPVELRASPAGLRVGVFLAHLPPGTGAQPAMVSGLARITPTTTPDVVPVLVARDTATSAPARNSTAMAIRYAPDVVVGTSLNGAEVPMRVVGRTRALPWVGRVGAVADLGTALDEYAPLFGQVVDVQLWTAPGTPPAMLNAVRDAGISLSPALNLAQRHLELHTDAFSMGMRLFLIVGLATLLLAVFGVFASAVLQSRWRAYEVAALRVVGVRRRSLVRASVLEYVVMLGVAAALGVLSTLVSVWLVLPSISLGPADEFDPTPVYDVPWAVVGAVGLGVFAIATMIALLVSRRIARLGRPSTLRWAEQG
jgi:hypothetical protein